MSVAGLRDRVSDGKIPCSSQKADPHLPDVGAPQAEDLVLERGVVRVQGGHRLPVAPCQRAVETLEDRPGLLCSHPRHLKREENAARAPSSAYMLRLLRASACPASRRRSSRMLEYPLG